MRRERSEGSLASLRRLNRRRVIGALRAARHDQPCRDRAPHRACRARPSRASSPSCSPTAWSSSARSPARRTASRAAARRSCSRSTPRPGAALGIDFGHSHVRVAVSDLSSTILAERAEPIDTDHAAQEGLDVALDLIEEVLGEAGHRALARDRRRPRAARPDRPVRRRHRLLGDPARLGRRRRRGGDAPPARRAGHRRQRRQPRRARRADPRRGPRRDRPRLPQALVGHRRRG